MTHLPGRRPLTLLSALAGAAAALAAAAPVHASGLYGTTLGAAPALYSIDPLTGTAREVGSGLPAQVSALTFDDGSLVAGTLDGNLYSIDAGTGQSSLLGATGNTSQNAQVFGLAALNNSLYGLQFDPNTPGVEGLYQFALTGSGVTESLLGDVLDGGGNPISARGLTVLGGDLVTADTGLGAGGYIYSLDPASGLATSLDTTGGVSSGLPLNGLDGLASQNGILYGFNNDPSVPDYSLYRISPGTAQTSGGVPVGTLPLGAIAFAAPSVPEPGAAWLLAPALALLAAARPRRRAAPAAVLAGLAGLALLPLASQAQPRATATPPYQPGNNPTGVLPQPPSNPTATATQNQLTTGKYLTLPPLGTETNVGSLPLNLVASPDGRYAVSSDMGFREYLLAVRTADGTETSSLDFNGKNGVTGAQEGLYYGLVFDPNKKSDGSYTLYAAQGNENTIAVLTLDANGVLSDSGVRFHGRTPSAPGIALLGGLTLNQLTRVPPVDTPAGLAMDARGYLYVTDDDPALPMLPAAVSVYDTKADPVTEVGRYTFPTTDNGTNYPYSLTALPDGSKVFIGSQRDGVVYVLSANDPATGASAADPQYVGRIAVGAHPLGLTLSADHARLYVANAQSDTVSVVDTASDAVTATVLLRPQGALSLPGVTPDALALSPDGTTLYATLGDMNAVAVIDAGRRRLRGYIPVGWYPTAVVATGGSLLVTNAKGNYTRYPNPLYGTMLANSNSIPTYNENMIEGDIQAVPLPTPLALARDTQLTLADNRITPLTDNPASNPLASIGLQSGKIRHILYIVKENRTYDQILGDLKGGPEDAYGNGTGAQLGNGDPSLAFGEQVTPNLHSLARRFVLLDNYYEGGEVSEDGWNWSTQGMANQFTIKNVPYNYSNRNYFTQTDFQGQNNGYPVGGFPATDINGKLNSILFPAGGPPITDIAQTASGYIWDDALRARLSYRNYGVDLSTGATIPGVGSLIPDNYPTHTGQHPEGHDLAGNSDYDYRHFDTNYPDSEAGYFYDYGTDPALTPVAFGSVTTYAPPPNAGTDPNALFAETQFGKYNAPSRYSEFAREFGEMLAEGTPARPDAGVPTFMTMTLMTDHTQGSTVGTNIHTPQSMIADDDYGVGQIVQLISHSPIWDSTAIFVIEDDSQDGPDHVDCHRSICYVISPYIKQSVVDSHFYNTDSVLKTMELLLGLPAMNQYDAVADPILDWNTTPANGAPYSAILPPRSVIDDLNMTPTQLAGLDHRSIRYRLAALSDMMDFRHPDAAPDQLLNEIIWKSIKGWGAPVPLPVHGLSIPAPGKPLTQTAGDDADR